MAMLLFILYRLWSIIDDSGSVVSSVVSSHPALLSFHMLAGNLDRALRALSALASHLPMEQRAEVLADALTVAESIKDRFSRVHAFGRLAPHLPMEQRAEVLADALTVARLIEDPSARAYALSQLAPHLSGNLLQQGFEELLDVLPKCGRDVSLFAISLFFPFLEEVQGLKGLEYVRCAIIDTAQWFP
jgi:hypothetical protein